MINPRAANRISPTIPLLRVGICALAWIGTFNCYADHAPVDPQSSVEASSNPKPPKESATEGTWASAWNAHFQLTSVTQAHGEFHSPYSGPNSLSSQFECRTSVTSTLFIGHKLWKDAYVFANPEEAIGSGLSGTHGIAGFPNGEIYRVSDPSPTINLSRLFLQQDFGLGGGSEQVEDTQNQFPAQKDIRRLTLVGGKFSLNDYFDDNLYSHDPRTQFLNWSLMDNGAWDYAADTRGYTWGLYAELRLEIWSFRLAIMQVPVAANQLDLDGNITHAHGDNAELEYRYRLANHPGTIRTLGYMNHARMGSYRESIDRAAGTGSPPDVTQTAAYRTKYGFGLNAEQELNPDLGLFSRIGWNDGATETWAFTEVDRTVSLGTSLKGSAWHRTDDIVGTALIFNGLSKDHADYLSAGGQGFILGDGALRYAPEQILEVYYLYKIIKEISATADFQFVNHPGYNADRGPVPIYAVRMHVEI